MYTDLRLHNALLASGERATIEISHGLISSVVEHRAGQSDPVCSPESIDVQSWVQSAHTLTAGADVDLDGRLVLPALVNGHAHLDKTFIGTVWQPHREGTTVAARVAAEREIRSGLDRSVHERAAALAESMVSFGTGTVRTHVDIDAELGISSLDAVLALKDEWRDRLRMQVVAFPQSGILASRGVEHHLADAIVAGADVVGGLDPAGFDGDATAHLDIVFGLADRFGVGVDIHLHELGRSAVAQYEQIVARTSALGMGGNVVISHAYGLGSISVDEARRLGSLFHGAGVAVMTNGPAGPMPPVLAMRAEGATVFSGSDNIRDAWWPFGSGDMLDVARQVAYQSNFRTDVELRTALDLVTDAAARGIGLREYGIEPGAPADLLVLERTAAAAVVASPPAWRVVLHGGRLVSATHTVSRDFQPAFSVPAGAQ